MEFRKKYIFMIPFTLLFLVISVESLVFIGDYSIREFIGNIFPLGLAIGFWILEFLKYEEVNKETETSGVKKRLLPPEKAVVPFVIVFAIYFILPSIAYAIDEALGLNQTISIVSMVFIIAPICVFLTLKLLKLDFEYIKDNTYKFISYILMFTVALFGLNIVINILYYIFDLQISGANEESINSTLNALPTFTKMIFIIDVIIAAPIVEELIFRGFPLQPVASKTANYIVAIAVSLVFAFLHYVASFDPNLLEFTDPISVFVPYFAMSMVFCTAYIQSDYNLLVPIGIHILNNFSALVIY